MDGLLMSADAAGRLDDRVCVITGAASGIGRATAELFHREGAYVVACDVDAEGVRRLADALPEDRFLPVTADVSRTDDVRQVMDAAVDRYGRLDVLVANAGVIPLMDVRQAEAEDFDQVMAVDGRGMFLSCKYAIEAMLTGPGGGAGGAIVCVSSISGEAGQKGQAVYGPAKFVASGLTKHLAVEWAGHGIRVNAVAPGTIRTERVERLREEPGGAEYLHDIALRHPLGRLGHPDEVAAAILFLASPEASFITGAVLPVDGGYLAQ